MMDFFSIPSLSFLSYAEIALAVFYNPDVYELAFQYKLPSAFLPGYTKLKRLTLHAILDVAVDKISTLKLSSSCRPKVRNLIMHMIREFLIWKQNHNSILDIMQLKNFRPVWTKQLTIDLPKTARIMIESKKFDISVCFILSCKFCFFEDALYFWSNMTAYQKDYLESLNRFPRYSTLEMWIRDTQFEQNRRDVLSFSSFIEARHLPLDEHVVRLILPTKSPTMQNTILLGIVTDTSIYNYQPDFKLKCFKLLSTETQEEILKEQPYIVLRSLLTWPFESLFLAVADSAMNYIEPYDFCCIVEAFIFCLENYEWQNFGLVEILQQFWVECPENLKDSAKGNRYFELLKILLNCNSLESLNSSSCALQELYGDIVGIQIVFERSSSYYKS